jgi:hypothetical protein
MHFSGRKVQDICSAVLQDKSPTNPAHVHMSLLLFVACLPIVGEGVGC